MPSLVSAYTTTAPSSRPIGSITARRVEDVFGLPHGWMDQVHVDPAIDAVTTMMRDMSRQERARVVEFLRGALALRNDTSA